MFSTPRFFIKKTGVAFLAVILLLGVGSWWTENWEAHSHIPWSPQRKIELERQGHMEDDFRIELLADHPEAIPILKSWF